MVEFDFQGVGEVGDYHARNQGRKKAWQANLVVKQMVINGITNTPAQPRARMVPMMSSTLTRCFLGIPLFVTVAVLRFFSEMLSADLTSISDYCWNYFRPV